MLKVALRILFIYAIDRQKSNYLSAHKENKNVSAAHKERTDEALVFYHTLCKPVIFNFTIFKTIFMPNSMPCHTNRFCSL